MEETAWQRVRRARKAPRSTGACLSSGRGLKKTPRLTGREADVRGRAQPVPHGNTIPV
jgi:hypothetical protein